MSQMNQVNVICLPHAGYMVKQVSPPLSPMQIRKSTGCFYFNCLQLTQIGESLYFHIKLQSSLCGFSRMPKFKKGDLWVKIQLFPLLQGC